VRRRPPSSHVPPAAATHRAPSATSPPQPPEVKAACAAAAEHCAAQGVDISSLALKFALRNPDIATTLVGMASVGVVRANVASALQVRAQVWPCAAPRPLAAVAGRRTQEAAARSLRRTLQLTALSLRPRAAARLITTTCQRPL
jgi:aryl-alcohol dehydrogenase-like predicted oxidoreductase